MKLFSWLVRKVNCYYCGKPMLEWLSFGDYHDECSNENARKMMKQLNEDRQVDLMKRAIRESKNE